MQPDDTPIRVLRWRNISFKGWPKAMRSQIHTLASQERDYRGLLHYSADLDYVKERLAKYGPTAKIPQYVREQLETSLDRILAETGRRIVPELTQWAHSENMWIRRTAAGQLL